MMTPVKEANNFVNMPTEPEKSMQKSFTTIDPIIRNVVTIFK